MADRVSGAAMRRRQRRPRSWWRHEQQSIAAALATYSHHNAQRLKTARAGKWGSEQNYTATIRNTPTPHPELFDLSLDEEPGLARPDRLFEVRPQERVQRHTVEQIILAPMQEQLSVDAFAPHDIQVPEQVIEVPKILIDELSVRTPVREPQLAEQLAEQLVVVPTIISFSSLQRIVEQNVDIPGEGLQDFRPGQSSSSSHFPAGIPEGLDEPGEGFFSLFPAGKKVR